MKRWAKEVKKVDKNLMSPMGFCLGIFPLPSYREKISYEEVLAAARIYIEDGGQKYTFDVFKENIIWAGHVEVPDCFAEVEKDFIAQPNPFVSTSGN